ncbi:MAG TPA: hypothetical protein VMB19_13900 [Silvibacterium sp.]|nr:hypothetical protein [Silvibacterium sp.]
MRFAPQAFAALPWGEASEDVRVSITEMLSTTRTKGSSTNIMEDTSRFPTVQLESAGAQRSEVVL